MHAPIAGPMVISQLYGGDQYGEAITTTFDGQPVQVIGHTGLDISCPAGTPALAVWDGVVRFGNEPGGFGTYLILTDARGRTALYGHLQGYLVADGSHVHVGQAIAHTGQSGRATGAHLHFEIKPAQPDWFNGYRGTIDPIASFDHAAIPFLDVSRV